MNHVGHIGLLTLLEGRSPYCYISVCKNDIITEDAQLQTDGGELVLVLLKILLGRQFHYDFCGYNP